MPRIRKETSNRKSTNDRAKRRKQVKESKRKAARAAKKNPQWKSKTKKDPGIPSEFPYKDQILAEVAEQRRLAAEEKERRKADKQRALAKARAIARGEPFEDSDAEENAEDDDEAAEEDGPTGKVTKKDLNVGAESIASLSAKFLTTELKPRPRLSAAAEEEEEEEEEEEVPVLINRDLPNLKAVLDKADVVLEVLDGRDPLAFRSKHIEQISSEMGKKLLLVVNKIDACPREAVASWSQYLRSEQQALLFRSASSFLPEAFASSEVPQTKKGKGKAKIPVNDAVGTESILAALSHYAKEKKGDEPLVVAVVGVVNVGKSSLINSLLKRSALPVYTLSSSSRGPTTTELPQEVQLEVDNWSIVLIDTPGLSFVHPEDSEENKVDYRVRDILLRSKGRIDRLKDPNPPIAHIASRANTEDLMLMYSLPAFAKGDATAFLSGVSRANQLVKKKGELDLAGAARIVLRDWSVGKLAHYTTPPQTSQSVESSKAAQDAFFTELYAKDEAILATLPTRKERRKAGGLVKLSAGEPDSRQATLEEHWASLQDSEDEEESDPDEADAQGMDIDDEEEDEAEEDDDDEEDNDEEDEDEEEEEEEEIAPPPVSSKQKRKRAVEAAPERPSKKVAFAPPSKQKKAAPVKHTPSKPTQQPLKSAQAPPKKVAKVKPAPAKADNKPKVANTSSKTKTKSAAAKKDDSGPEAYDFGKFF
ncbi:hypothetical protein D9613_011422 [Agrocybe pediades]|uniref:CP-type G domain-containing protein n=1 Tax=Agrocybe pediades TaxID=84607 RepID=A0A8H4VN80_9AGAR|nr:hypothetical protein D9613_011422 [Agrocybe pediades]